MALLGIDVSTYQGDVNWATVASQGVFYAIAKATEGAASSDDKFARNWSGMRSVGIVRGAYHFFRPGKDPAVQADNFLRIVQKIEDFDLPAVLDLEITDQLGASVIIDRALKWLEILEAKTGRKPILYTYPSFWEDKLGNTTRFSAYPLWIANFGTPGKPYIPSAWQRWTFHQYSESGTLRGIVGNVDLNQFNGDLDGLQRLLKGRIPLRQGCEGNVVQEMQTLLESKGFDIGTPDGDFGPKTKAQVTAFQRARNLLADGIVGAATWSALQGSNPTVPPTPVPTAPPAPVPIDLINVCKSYRGAAHQDAALKWLQSQISKSVLDDFAKRWRQP